MAASGATSLFSMFKKPSLSLPASQISQQSLASAYANMEINKQRKGSASTWLTGPSGVASEASTKQTLGA
jgi:hypothetical protein